MTANATEPATQALPQPAHPWRRFMGMCYEGVILFGVIWFMGYAFSALTQYRAEGGAIGSAFSVYLGLILGLYFVGFWRNGWRTLPMKTMSMQLRGPDDNAVSTLRALTRFVGATIIVLLGLAALKFVHPGLAGLILLSPLIWAAFDPDKQTPYDRLAGTRLVFYDPVTDK